MQESKTYQTMLDTPIEVIAGLDVQQQMCDDFIKCVHEIEQATSREERMHIIGRVCKGMFVLGRWASMILFLVHELDIWF